MSEQLPERVQIPRARLHTSRSEQLRAAIYGDQYTIKELAEALGVKWRTIYSYMRAGCPYNQLGTHRTFTPEQVREWMRNRQPDRSVRPVGRPRKART